MLYFDIQKRHMKEEKDITAMKNNKGYCNERYCHISESRWDVEYFEKCTSHCLA